MAHEALRKARSIRSDVALVIAILLLLSGVGLLAAYLAPEVVGQALGGAAILVLGITFAGTLLIYLSVLPADGEPTDDGSTAESAT